MKKTSLKDLAKHLGLSQTTVSRGLSNYPEVTETTKALIRAAAAELNYAPSSSAQKLAMGRSFTIGHIVTLSQHMTINPVYADFIAGAGETYAAHGYDMLLSMASKDQELATYRNLTNAQKVDGFILSEPVPGDARIALLQELGIPFLVHGRAHSHAEDTKHYAWLDVDNRQGVYDGTSHLIAQGHHDIAFLNGPESLHFALERRRGFEKALQEASLTPHPSWLVSADMTEQQGYEHATRLLSEAKQPTAIICSSVLMALGIQRAATAKGLSLGRDLSVLCWDDCLSGFHDSAQIPQFTAMQSSIFEAGAMIAELLISKIISPQSATPQTLLKAPLVEGKSTGPGPYF